jgi:hypothetical protein
VKGARWISFVCPPYHECHDKKGWPVGGDAIWPHIGGARCLWQDGDQRAIEPLIKGDVAERTKILTIRCAFEDKGRPGTKRTAKDVRIIPRFPMPTGAPTSPTVSGSCI